MVRKRKEHRLLYEMINSSDLVFEIVDSRFPLLTRSSKVEIYAKRNNKNLIILMNKTDLIPKEIAEKWKKFLKRDYLTIFASAHQHQGTSRIRNIITSYLKKRPAKICMVGIPNTGKSSIINALKGKKSALTGQRAGFTRGIQFIKLTSQLMLLDSPGIAPIDDLSDFEKIVSGSLNAEDIKDPDLVIAELIEKIAEGFPNSLENYCKIPYEGDPIAFLEKLSLKRFGKLKIEEVSRVVIRDFQKGKITYYHHPPES